MVKQGELMFLKDNNVIDMEEAKKTIASLKAAGSGEPPEGDGENWLRKFTAGTIFLARKRNEKYVQKIRNLEDLALPKFMLIEHRTGVSNILLALGENRQMDIWVPTLEFSRAFELMELLSVIDIGDEIKETPIVNTSNEEKE